MAHHARPACLNTCHLLPLVRKKPERLAAGSAGNVGQEILKCANAKISLLQGLNGLRGGATA